MRNIRKAVMMAHTRDNRKDDNYSYEPENRYRDNRGREHYDNGRYAPMDRLEPYDRWWTDPYPAHYMPYRNADENYPPMMGGRGFRERGEPNYYPEMIGYSGGNSTGVLSMYDSPRYQANRKLSKEDADRWVKGMRNADGSFGGHWTMEQTNQVAKQKNIDCEPEVFYAVMNMMYSDYGKVAKKYGFDNVDFWVDMSKAFIDDADAGADKVAKYYSEIANMKR